jgi:hypothetical protein
MENERSMVVAKDWRTYQLFGVTMLSSFPFASHVGQTAGDPELLFECNPQAPIPAEWELDPHPLYASPRQTKNGESAAYLYQLENCAILRLTRFADFYLWSNRIVCHLLEPALGSWVEIRFLGTVLSLWLESRGLPVIHASAVVQDGQAIGFLASNRGGKSSLAATMVKSGHSLLTDDLLPIEMLQGTPHGYPSYPQMRLWPEDALHVLGYKDCETLEHVHPECSKRRIPIGLDGFGTFCDTCRPIACIYLPRRYKPTGADPPVEIVPVHPQKAMMELLRLSFSARIVEALGLQPQRLDVFASLVQQIPLRLISYPSGVGYLDKVREAILMDLDHLQ